MYRVGNIAELVSKVGNGTNSGYRWHNLSLNNVYHNNGVYYDKLQEVRSDPWKGQGSRNKADGRGARCFLLRVNRKLLHFARNGLATISLFGRIGFAGKAMPPARTRSCQTPARRAGRFEARGPVIVSIRRRDINMMKGKFWVTPVILAAFATVVFTGCDSPTGNDNQPGNGGGQGGGGATPATFTVTFNSHGGSAVTDQRVTQGGTATRPRDPTRGATHLPTGSAPRPAGPRSISPR